MHEGEHGGCKGRDSSGNGNGSGVAGAISHRHGSGVADAESAIGIAMNVAAIDGVPTEK